MKKVFSIFLFLPLFVFAQPTAVEKGIHFEHTSFAEILAKAKKENKMIFIDAYTTWCGPCKWMAKNVFTNDTAAEFYNKNFINAKIDMEKGEGIDLAKKYNVSCYPTLLFIDASGELVHRQSGGIPVKEFVALGTDAANPVKQFASAKKKYDSGTGTADEMAEYVLMRARTCLSAKEEMTKYFATQSESELTNNRNWSLMKENYMNMNIDSREFKYLVSHKAEYEKLYNPESVNIVIKQSYSFAMYNCAKEKNNEGYKKIKEELLKNNFPFGEGMVLNSDMSLYKSNKDWKNYAATTEAYINKFGKDDVHLLNTVAWGFYENIDDKALLAKAAEWAKHSVELEPAYYNNDTYAAVLYKLGKKAEAQAAAEKAIELAKKDGEDYKETQLLLDKIKALK